MTDLLAILDLRIAAILERRTADSALMLMWDNGLCVNVEGVARGVGFEHATCFEPAKGWSLPKVTNGNGEVAVVVTVGMARARALADCRAAHAAISGWEG